MCLAVPAKIVKIDNGMGTIDVSGVKKHVSLLLLEEAKVGDYILVHAGFGIQILHEEHALESLKLLKYALEQEDARTG